MASAKQEKLIKADNHLAMLGGASQYKRKVSFVVKESFIQRLANNNGVVNIC